MRSTILLTRPAGFSSFMPNLSLSRPITCLGETFPRPIWATRSSTEWKESSFAMAESCSLLVILAMLMCTCSRAFSRKFFPRLMLSFFSWLFIHCLILVFARGVFTNSSQSLLGCCFEEVMISMISPFFNFDRRGTILPLTLAPMHFSPTSE